MKNKMFKHWIITVLFLQVISNNPIDSQRLLTKCLKNYTVCDNIFVYRKARQEFVTLRNVSFTNFEKEVMRDMKVRVVANSLLPYINYNETTDILDGYLGEIWRILEDALKFKSILKSTDYDSALELISEGGADVVLAAAVVKDDLINIEYSQPYFFNWYHLYLRKPKAQASSSSYLKTLNTQLWIASGITFIILACTIWVTVRILNRFVDRDIDPKIPLLNCLIATCSAFLNQGFDIQLQSLTGRIQLFFALIFGLMLYMSMNAVLVAQLAVFEMQFPVKSLEDLSIKRSHSLCMRNTSFVYNNFTIKHSEENKTILPKWHKIVNGPGCLDINNQDNIQKIICNENIIVLENRAVMSAVVKNYLLPCTITHLPEKLFVRSNHFLVLKSFKGKRLISLFMQRLRSAGVIERIEKQWIPSDNSNSNEVSNFQMPQVTMEHIFGIILIFLITIPIALGILFIEKLYFNRTMKYNYIN